MSFLRVNFLNANGENLSARLEIPLGKEPKAYVLFAHCFTCSKDLNVVRNISRALTQAGFAVLGFDFTGLGESEGDFADTNFSSNVEDLVAANQFMRARYKKPCILVGHSFGGAAVILAAHQIDDVDAVVTIGAPSDISHVQHLFQDSISTIEQSGVASVLLGGRKFMIKKQFMDNLQNTYVQEAVTKLRKPLLVFHSPQDNVVSIDHAAVIYTSANHPKSFISLDGADHLLSSAKDAHYVGSNIASWCSRYLVLDDDEEFTTSYQTAVRIVGEGFTTQVVSRQHSMLADEPKKLGGQDLGPTPYELLLSSLGVCSAMTVRMYASRKQWPVDQITVHLSYEKLENEEGKPVDCIARKLEVVGNLNQEQKQRLLKIADKCPVHKTLSSGVAIETSFL